MIGGYGGVDELAASVEGTVGEAEIRYAVPRWKEGEALADAEWQRVLSVSGASVSEAVSVNGTMSASGLVNGLGGVSAPRSVLMEASAHEFVGLGLVLSDGRVVWRELKNAAPAGSLLFTVAGEDVHAALSDVRQLVAEENADDDAVGVSDHDTGGVQGHGSSGVSVPLSVSHGLLWHSHYASVKPSKLDIKHFPAWYAKVGIVYHAPTQTSRAYDASGLLSFQCAVSSYDTGME